MKRRVLSRLHLLVLLGILLGSIQLSSSINDTNPPFLDQNAECLVPCDEIVDGGPPPDGIPPLENPKFRSVTQAEEYMDDDDLVIGVVMDDEIKAYPYKILNWHEIVNDVFNGVHTSVTYCPLTGSGILYRISQGSQNNTFGTSGNLYENNLVMYDRETGSYFSQMMGVGIKGELINTTLDMLNTIESTWAAWKQMYPESQVLSTNTGYSRNYDMYPYGNYKNSDDIYFPSSFPEGTEIADFYHEKTLTTVVKTANLTHLISFSELEQDNAFEFDDKVVLFDQFGQISSVFSRIVDGEQLEFSPITNNLAGDYNLQAYTDQFDTIWNIRGEAIAGPMDGKKLVQIPSYNAFWFSVVSLFQGAIIHLASSDVVMIPIADPATETTNQEVHYAHISLPTILLMVAYRSFLNKKGRYS